MFEASQNIHSNKKQLLFILTNEFGKLIATRIDKSNQSKRTILSFFFKFVEEK